jgi:signal transduction histidine kinase
MTVTPLLTIDLRTEPDVVQARHRVRQVAHLLGVSDVEKTALATAVSEVARNVLRHAGRGQVDLSLRQQSPAALVVRVRDEGPGIPHLDDVLSGRSVSPTGSGLGLIGAKRLSDEFDVDTAPGRGTVVTLAVRLPAAAAPSIPALTDALSRQPGVTPLEEAAQQNRELLAALEHVRVRQAEVERLNGELAETNRGVVALYAELDEKADSLRRASEYKSRFLSDMTHELRTPLNAMISLSRLLLSRSDGDLTPEQERQVALIHKSATSLGEMVNDLLDLAKIEAGRLDLSLADFDPAEVLSGLRGIFRPLLLDGRVQLLIEDPAGPLVLHSDERKLTQILRNVISNALKFTEQGRVTVTVATPDPDHVEFVVADTGIGIEPRHQSLIFEDYTQIDSTVQRHVRGTGLGLPLTRKLARLLGGEVTVHSKLGEGSTFVVRLPRRSVAPEAPQEPVHA